MFGTACGERFWWKGTAQWTALIYLGMAWVFGNWLSCFWARVLRTPQNYHKIVLACVIYAMGLWAENFASRETSFGEMAFSFLCYFGWLSGGVPRAGWSLLKDSHLNSLPPNPWQVLRCTSHLKNASICTCDFECSLLWLLMGSPPETKNFLSLQMETHLGGRLLPLDESREWRVGEWKHRNSWHKLSSVFSREKQLILHSRHVAQLCSQSKWLTFTLSLGHPPPLLEFPRTLSGEWGFFGSHQRPNRAWAPSDAPDIWSVWWAPVEWRGHKLTQRSWREGAATQLLDVAGLWRNL